jgi:hypothetical protein
MRGPFIVVALAAACSSSSSSNGPRGDGGVEAATEAGADDGGTVPAGGMCSVDTDCQIAPGAGNAAYCWALTRDGGFAPSLCFQVSPGMKGSSPCFFTAGAGTMVLQWNGTSTKGYSCARADGLRCDAATWTCAPSSQAGQPCSVDNDCLPADHCDTTTSTCAAGKASGMACTSNQECASGVCDTSHTCR